MRIVPPTDHWEKRARRRERVLKTVAVLPSLATLGNLVCGLGAIYICLLSVHAAGEDLFKDTLGSARLNAMFPTFIAIAAYLIFASMFFDGIDGRLARMTRKTSEFGAQLDSMADVVSFGVAPAVLVLCIAHPGDVMLLSKMDRIYWRAEWVMVAIYVCCAALRLARFNVENVADEAAHMGFKGLPTPGAAFAMIGLVIFHQDLLQDITSSPWTSRFVARLMPPFSALLGLLMVSRFRYPHLVNTLLRGRRSFRQVVGLLILLLAGLVVHFQLTMALAAAIYALSGPTGAAVRRLRGGTESVASAALAMGDIVSGPAARGGHDETAERSRKAE